MADRIYGKKIPIDQEEVRHFFSDRAKRELDPIVSMLYQDSNPALALQRDEYEKNFLEPMLRIRPTDRVLDIGCGVGRWAGVFRGKVAAYHGIDPVGALLDAANEIYGNIEGFSFQHISGESAQQDSLSARGPFNIILIAGVLHYLNDEEAISTLNNAGAVAADGARLLIRGPIGVGARLTLRDIWSEELQHSYSAIYRTREEVLSLFEEAVYPSGFRLTHDGPLYPSALNNRADTMQHVFLLERP